MKTKIITVAMLFVLLAGVIAIAVHVQPASAQDTTLGFNPSLIVKHKPSDSFFDVDLVITDVENLFGFDIKITWATALITGNTADYATYLGAIWGPVAGTDYQVVTHDLGVGYYRYVALSLNNEFTTMGTQTLLRLRFDIVDPSTNSMKQTTLHFEINKLSTKDYQEIVNTANDGTVQIWGKTPTLSLMATKTNCQMLDETFDVAVEVSDALSVTSLTFDIRYDAVLLDVVSVIWGVWAPTGTEDHSADGKVTGSTSGIAQDGTQTLLTITFKAAYNHIWKDVLTVSGWQNDVTGSIYIQSATLGYPDSQPTLTYTNGGGSSNTIIYGGDVTYTWSPIQGDVNLDGSVDIFDLVLVAGFYDQNNATYNLTGTGNLIDIYDLVVIANNFWYVYHP